LAKREPWGKTMGSNRSIIKTQKPLVIGFGDSSGFVRDREGKGGGEKLTPSTNEKPKNVQALNERN